MRPADHRMIMACISNTQAKKSCVILVLQNLKHDWKKILKGKNVKVKKKFYKANKIFSLLFYWQIFVSIRINFLPESILSLSSFSQSKKKKIKLWLVSLRTFWNIDFRNSFFENCLNSKSHEESFIHICVTIFTHALEFFDFFLFRSKKAFLKSYFFTVKV